MKQSASIYCQSELAQHAFLNVLYFYLSKNMDNIW